MSMPTSVSAGCRPVTVTVPRIVPGVALWKRASSVPLRSATIGTPRERSASAAQRRGERRPDLGRRAGHQVDPVQPGRAADRQRGEGDAIVGGDVEADIVAGVHAERTDRRQRAVFGGFWMSS